MSANTRADGLLKTLQKMNEVDRGRIVEYLPPEEVRAAFLLVLHEQDRANTVLQDEQLVDDPVTLQPIVPIHEPASMSTKRRNSAENPNDSKRAKTDLALLQNDRGSAARVVVKKEQEIIDLLSDDEEVETMTDDRPKKEEVEQPFDLPKAQESKAEAQPEHEAVQQPSNVPVYFHIRPWPHLDVLKDINELPLPVIVELKRRFERIWWSNRTVREPDYATYISSPFKYANHKWCVRNTILRGDRNANRMYNKGGEYKKAADDRCIHTKDPCAHFVKHNDQYIIFLVPLPEAYRIGKEWTQLGYWVL